MRQMSWGAEVYGAFTLPLHHRSRTEGYNCAQTGDTLMKINKSLHLMALVLLALALMSVQVRASSHREAPLITTIPKVDGTDFYMFRSYESGHDGFVTLIANYFPFQEPWGGPNYYTLDPNAFYDIVIDNVGDGVPHLIFRFKFTNTIKNIALNVGGKTVEVPLLNVGSVPGSSPGTNSGNVNVTETFTVQVINASPGFFNETRSITNANTGAKVFLKPTDNIGCKSYDSGSPVRCADDDSILSGSYARYAANFVYDIHIPGCGEGRMFVGPRQDPFVVNLGETFDLVNYLDPVCSDDSQTSCFESSANTIQFENVTAMELEVPISCLVSNPKSPVIGAWTRAFLPQNATLPIATGTVTEGGSVQVSRLGMPLVNELLIGLGDKDLWNGSQPQNDHSEFYKYFTNPTLPALIEALFGVQAPTLFPRNDLVRVFLTGVPGLNQSPGGVKAEELRLNTSIPPVACNGVATPSNCKSITTQNYLGVIGFDGATCQDIAGFPNGRRLGDDVVDIELRVSMGRLIALGLFGSPSQAPAGNLDFTDGAHVDCTMFSNAFPYTNTPIPGSPNGPNGRPSD